MRHQPGVIVGEPGKTTRLMNDKAAQVLELPKILEQLARFTTFGAGTELALTLAPTADPILAREWQAETSEARHLLKTRSEITLGGARDVRAAALQAAHGILLETQTLLDIRSTLRRATILRRTLSRIESEYPRLAEIADQLEECSALQGEISQTIDDNGNVQDSASPRLAIIRRDLRLSFERLQSRLLSLVNNSNNARFLQEQLVTQRNGRYVIPIRAEFKGRIPGIVHDQSSSGATIFIEPLATVELNNSWRELQLEEENEIRRILLALSERVGQESPYIVRTVETLAYIDLTFAKALYADQLRATEPKLVGFRFTESSNSHHPGSVIKLEQARHPLLPALKVVPIDVTLDNDTYMLVITGPNTGGKTVALKTVGLLTLMAQCGLHVPADLGAELSIFEDVFADIGDEQSIEQSLSTFSSHMTNIARLLKSVNRRSLVILDELGAGTDPAEGAALARAILAHLLEVGVTTLVTTHHPELKVFSHERPGVRNASVEFDLQTLAPTYRLIIGLPGRSNALAIASRLGLPQDILDAARHMVGAEELLADDLLDELHKTREETRTARDAAIHAQATSEQLEQGLRAAQEALEREKRDALTEARRMADRELDAFRAELRHLKRDMQAAAQPLEALKRVEAAAGDLRASIMPSAPETPGAAIRDDDRPSYRLGETIWVIPLKSEGEITELSDHDAEVAIGRLRVRAKLDEISKRAKAGATTRPRGSRDPNPSRPSQPSAGSNIISTTPKMRGLSPGLELDLRGLRVEDGLTQLDNYLDAAYTSGLPFVRIIHGKGTGAMRKAIRDALQGHPLVSHYEGGNEKEGGDGVTVVNLAPQM
ncbi:MAG: endonuclease MutS2 [Aggregatilineales bacterium]